MKIFKLDEMTRGWFVGPFQPVALTTDACEVAVKRYDAGDKGKMHHHKESVEITLVLTGGLHLIFSDKSTRYLDSGEMVRIERGESMRLLAIHDTITVVVKVPGVREDKHIDE